MNQPPRLPRPVPTLRSLVVVGTGVAVALLVACSVHAEPALDAAQAPATASVASPSPEAPLVEIPVRPADDASIAPPPAPIRLTVADLDLDMTVVEVGTEADGTMSLPSSGAEAGWYRFGAAPASTAGTTVLASHVDTLAEGLGPFARLREAQVGTAVTVTDEDGTVHSYTVSSVERITKTQVPLDDVFDRAGPPRLVLLTCGGAWDESVGHYEDNVIVTAVPGT